MNSRIYNGRVMHARNHPIKHRFEYPILFYAIDLDELPALAQNVKGFSTGPGSPVSLRSEDYLVGSNRFRDQLAPHFTHPKIERIVLVTVARFLLPTFNPVNFYYGLNAQGTPEQLLVEVNNTFKQKHIYLVNGDDTYPIETQMEKQFHVSPFNQIEGHYTGSFSEPGDQIRIGIRLMQNNQCTLDTALWGEGELLTSQSLWRSLARHPFTTAATLPRIYWQAAQLHWRRGLQIHTTPPPAHPNTSWRKK